jgi:phosphohistidine swiveling domain-containing protein
MEEIKLIIKKAYARDVIADLEKMDAIVIEKEKTANPAELIGSWKKETIEKIDATIEKLKSEWQ